MQIIFSPTKSMKILPPQELIRLKWPPRGTYTPPFFPIACGALYDSLEEQGPEGRAAIWGIEDKLLEKAEDDFQNFVLPIQQAPAIFAYNGLQYKNLDAMTLSNDELDFLEEQVFILSGLFGCVKPSSAVRPYRLEMKSRWAIETPEGRFDNLYDYWRPHLQTLFGSGNESILNLASDEYSKALGTEILESPRCYHVHIGEIRPNKEGVPAFRAFSTLAKMGRGRLLRFIAQQKITEPEGLKAYQTEELAFNPELSNEHHLYFTPPTTRP